MSRRTVRWNASAIRIARTRSATPRTFSGSQASFPAIKSRAFPSESSMMRICSSRLVQLNFRSGIQTTLAARLDSIPVNWHEPPTPALSRDPMKIKTFFTRLFTWWNGQTFGTQVWTALYGEFVGEDEFGNRYYRTKGGKIDPALGFERSWVIYSGAVEASSIPP